LANEKADQIEQYLAKDFSGSEAKRKETNLTGFAGQIAFSYYVGEAEWRKLVDSIPIGRYDDGDVPYKGYNVDVKSSATRSPPTLFVTVSDFTHRQYDLYPLVWVHWELKEAWILGWATGDEVAKAKIDPRAHRKPAYGIGFDHLHEPREALSLLPKSPAQGSSSKVSDDDHEAFTQESRVKGSL